MGYKDVQGMKTIRDAANLAMGLVAQQSKAAAQAAAVKQGRQAAFNSTLAPQGSSPTIRLACHNDADAYARCYG